MNPIGLNREQCVQALQVYGARIETLIEIIADEEDSAKPLLSKLKRDVRSDGEIRDGRYEQRCTLDDVIFYYPAIVSLYSDLSEIDETSQPGYDWIFQLTLAQSTIAESLEELLYKQRLAG